MKILLHGAALPPDVGGRDVSSPNMQNRCSRRISTSVPVQIVAALQQLAPIASTPIPT